MLGAICGDNLGSTYEVKMKDDLFSDLAMLYMGQKIPLVCYIFKV